MKATAARMCKETEVEQAPRTSITWLSIYDEISAELYHLVWLISKMREGENSQCVDLLGQNQMMRT